jgi:hypothetical protein
MPCHCRGCFDGDFRRHEVIQQIKLERLAAVREQEKLLSRVQSSAYNQFLGKLKREKLNESREIKVEKKREELLNLRRKGATLLVQAGDAHRSAESYQDEVDLIALDKQKREKKWSKRQEKREIVATKLRKEEIAQNHKHFEDAKQLASTRVEMGTLDREAAHMNRESKLARAAVIADNRRRRETSGSSKEKIQQTTLQSSVSVLERGNVYVHAKVIRHGVDPAVDASVVRNASAEEKDQHIQRLRAKVHKELRSIHSSRSRYASARQRAHEQRVLSHIGDGFEVLETIDRSGDRQERLKNVELVRAYQEKCVTSNAVTRGAHAAVDARARVAFEKQFSSKAVAPGRQTDRNTHSSDRGEVMEYAGLRRSGVDSRHSYRNSADTSALGDRSSLPMWQRNHSMSGQMACSAMEYAALGPSTSAAVLAAAKELYESTFADETKGSGGAEGEYDESDQEDGESLGNSSITSVDSLDIPAEEAVWSQRQQHNHYRAAFTDEVAADADVDAMGVGREDSGMASEVDDGAVFSELHELCASQTHDESKSFSPARSQDTRSSCSHSTYGAEDVMFATSEGERGDSYGADASVNGMEQSDDSLR